MKLPKGRILKLLVDEGMTVKDIAKKYETDVKIVRERLHNENSHRTRNSNRKPLSELDALIQKKGHDRYTLSVKMGYGRNAVTYALNSGISIGMLESLAKELELTDNEIARIVKGELR